MTIITRSVVIVKFLLFIGSSAYIRPQALAKFLSTLTQNDFRMKKVLILSFLLLSILSWPQLSNVSSGEVLKYRIHYGFINGGFATLTANQVMYKGTPHMRVRGEGVSSGAVSVFFKVNDVYESYVNMQTGLPDFYIRNVREGSYRRHSESTFNHVANKVYFEDKRKGIRDTFKIPAKIQDMISSFYYLRNLSPGVLKPGAQVRMNVWIEDEVYPFLLKVTGRDTLNTSFGKIDCLRIVPYVQKGRVFKSKEGVTMWVTNDQNHIPIQIKAELAVGSLKADLMSYSGVKYPIRFHK